MPTWSRKRVEPILLAVVAFASVMPLRFLFEHQLSFGCEILAIAAAAVLATGKPSLRQKIATGLTPLVPILFAVGSRFFGTPITLEMTALTSFGAASIAMAVGGHTDRTRALSMVLGGFLVLFCASISEYRFAIVFPIAWMLGCVWHLVANHWERLDLAMPDSVSRTWTLRPATLIATCLVLLIGAYAVKGRFTESKHLAMGFMPTSGGSKWSDPAARSGVGTGDAAIAAKDHAESFGAVDSDIMLESTESSLFDMFSDQIGEPKKVKVYERRQAVGDENVIRMHEQASRSDKGGGSFSASRKPIKEHRHYDDARDPSIVQWDGPTGIRLAMHRYDTFDGEEWTHSSEAKKRKVLDVNIGGDHWFFDPRKRHLIDADADSVSVGLLKVIRLDSPRMPVPMMTAAVHIKEVDRQDFFGIEQDGCFYMPDREKIPPLTILHVASASVSEDEIRDGLVDQQADGPPQNEKLGELTRRLAGDHAHPYDQLQSVVDHLRTEFDFDRNFADETGGTVEGFLQSRRGGDHLFATTAALMAREPGLKSRLVTGFYVRPDAFDLTAGHSSVLARDVHVWAEVQFAGGEWFEIEPTPGYQQPDYQPSFWLLTRRFVAASAPAMAVIVVAAFICFFTRRIWIEYVLSLTWKLAGGLRPRHKWSLAMRIIEIRARLAGQRRPMGRTQRDWIEELTERDDAISHTARQFCDVADELFFGRRDLKGNESANHLVRLLSTQTISQLTKEAM